MAQLSAARRRVLICCAFFVVGGGALSAQFPAPAAVCPKPVPAPFAAAQEPSVTVRLMAEGEFPDADVAAARAINLLLRDLITDRAPVGMLSSIDVQRKIEPTVATASDTRGIAPGGKLLTAIVKRVGDSVVVQYSVRSAAAALNVFTPMRRVTFRVDDVARGALTLAEAASQASAASNTSMGTASPALGSVEAGDAYVVGLAEALSTTPDALRRARSSLVKAALLAPLVADTWRWRARVEYSLIEWNRSAGPNALRGLQITLVSSAVKSAKLAPRSAGALVTLANAYLASGERQKAETTLTVANSLHADGPEVSRLAASLSRIRGDDALALEQLRDAVRQSPRDGSLLVELASLARLRGQASLACHALNAAVASDDELAPAYALRALVRADLGERRAAWVDAEVATRLGHPEWGERVAAVLDARYGDADHASGRLSPLGGLHAVPANYLDAILIGEAAIAVSRRGAVPNLANAWPCKDLRRGALVRDLRSLGVTITDKCNTPTSFSSATSQKISELWDSFSNALERFWSGLDSSAMVAQR